MFIRKTDVTAFEELSLRKVKDFFLAGRMNSEWKANTFETYHKTIFSFLSWAQKQSYLNENFLEHIEVPKWRKRLPKRLKKEQAEKWLKYVRNYPYQHHTDFVSKRNHAIYATFIYTGIRRAELANLEMRDIDLVNLELSVRGGKGDKDRIIPLCFTHAQILKSYLDKRKLYNKTCPHVFVSIRRNQGLSIASLVYVHQTMLAAAPFHCTFHQFRHTFATLMIEGGCDIVSLSSLMGHADISTTMIYVKVSNRHLKSQIIKHPLNRI